jgi:medium-chain acyl-[acyl-carrier-protein] hydrolase
MAMPSKLRLFCFPYAGGRSQVFREWVGAFTKGIEVCPIQLPGESLREDCATNVHDLVPTMADALLPYFDKPFALFGHSMGAIIALELLRFLQRERRPGAVHLFVSARSAPGVVREEAPLHSLPQAELVNQLRLLNGTPPEVLDNEDLLEILLPRLRADFQLNETYIYQPGELLQCPITAFAGIKDSHARPDEMRPWASQTTGKFSFQLMSGDHFFLQTERAVLLESISAALATHLSNCR